MPPLKLTLTETLPKAKTEILPAAQNMLPHSQKPMPKHSHPKPLLIPQANPDSYRERTAQATHEASYPGKPCPGQKDKGHETTTSGS